MIELDFMPEEKARRNVDRLRREGHMVVTPKLIQERPDLFETRLAVVKKMFAKFVEARPDDLIGLVTFGGYAATRAPLTADHEMLLHVLKGVMVPTTAYDSRLQQYLTSAQQMIEREGATLDVSLLEDAQLVVMYSAWLWRKRDSGEGMPRMLRWALNNRILSEKANG